MSYSLLQIKACITRNCSQLRKKFGALLNAIPAHLYYITELFICVHKKTKYNLN